MAEKILQTRIINKHTSYDIATTNETFIPKLGEIVLAKLDVQQNDGQTIPTFLMKVGDGEKSLKALNWLHAPASDVYAWAKQPTLAYDALPQTLRDEIDALQAAVGGEGSVAEMIASAIEGAIAGLDSEFDGEGSFVKAVTQTDGKVSVTYGKIEISDVEGLTNKIAEYRTSAAQDEIDAAQNEAIAAAKKAGEDAAAAVAGDLSDYESSNDERVKAIEDEVDTFGDIVTHDVGEFATAAQGATADATAATVATYGDIVTHNAAEFEAAGAASEAEGRINETLKSYYTKTEADAEFATPSEVIAEVNKALADVSDADTITNITTLVEYVNNNAGDLAGLITEVYGSAEMTGDSRLDLVEGRLDALEDAPAADITDDDISGWNGELGAKELAQGVKDVVDANKETWDKAGTALQAADLADYAKSADVTAEIGAAVAPKLDSSVFEEYKTDRILTDTQINDALAGKETAGAAAAAESAAKAYTDELAGGAVKANTEAIAAINHTETGILAQAAADATTKANAAQAAAEATAAGALEAYAETTDAAIKTINDNYVRVSGSNLVFGQGEEELTIIFDCGGIE